MNREKLSQERNKALSPVDIFRIAEKTCNVLKYPDLKDFEDIDQLFEEGSSLYKYLTPEYDFDNNTCILLYMSHPNFGHWCSISRIPENGRVKYQFLDPYGTIIDDQLEYIKKEFREESDQDKAYLCKLLLKAIDEDKADVHYNEKRMQKLDGKTSTCGRYAALFLKYNQVPVEDFAKILMKASKKHKIEVDDLVTAMTL